LSKVKGSNIINRQAYVTERFGPDAWRRVLARLGAEDAGGLSPRILASAWYPFEIYNRVDETICQLFGGGSLTLCRALGADSARRALSGTYRVYMKDGPVALLRRLSVLHRTFYDSGSMTVTVVGEGHCVIRAVYVPRSTRTNCLVAQAFYRKVVEMCGGRDVQVNEATCSADGAPLCLVNVRWSEAC
jgi:hypothetical protein